MNTKNLEKRRKKAEKKWSASPKQQAPSDLCRRRVLRLGGRCGRGHRRHGILSQGQEA